MDYLIWRLRDLPVLGGVFCYYSFCLCVLQEESSLYSLQHGRAKLRDENVSVSDTVALMSSNSSLWRARNK